MKRAYFKVQPGDTVIYNDFPSKASAVVVAKLPKGWLKLEGDALMLACDVEEIIRPDGEIVTHS